MHSQKKDAVGELRSSYIVFLKVVNFRIVTPLKYVNQELDSRKRSIFQ